MARDCNRFFKIAEVQFFSLLHPNKGKITFKNGGLKLAFSQIFQFRLGTIDFVGVKVVRVMLFLVAFFSL